MQKANLKSKVKSDRLEDRGESCKSWGKFYNIGKKETVVAPMQIAQNDAQFKLILPQTRSKTKKKKRGRKPKDPNKLVVSDAKKFKVVRKEKRN